MEVASRCEKYQTRGECVTCGEAFESFWEELSTVEKEGERPDGAGIFWTDPYYKLVYELDWPIRAESKDDFMERRKNENGITRPNFKEQPTKEALWEKKGWYWDWHPYSMVHPEIGWNGKGDQFTFGGMAALESEDIESFVKDFREVLFSMPEDTLVVAVDCHI